MAAECNVIARRREGGFAGFVGEIGEGFDVLEGGDRLVGSVGVNVLEEQCTSKDENENHCSAQEVRVRRGSPKCLFGDRNDKWLDVG